ncbi:Mor transcription activator family protein [Paralysiella testudinis]|uniref:Mor transcription activator domain-containing protein n=1 Tax=Paralysiella testudinis TaxID=2809020 RepID=A0A892ZLC0_9NEIS|nr:Mor transcription activator family protein [Paralysiella testudinis]QRQ82344.1 hypothetical protein JQU52_02745 [Paralysiella testudinis]
MNSNVNHDDFYDVFSEAITATLVQEGISPKAAARATINARHSVYRTFRGQNIYIKKQNDEELLERNLQLFEDHSNGCSVPELARKYELSVQRVYGIIRCASQGDKPC